ncbi:hypothetical protein HN011_001296 [Eciton burchellii]|nr:hypothetical protein HN011_001296 [Eciton burchellii]
MDMRNRRSITAECQRRLCNFQQDVAVIPRFPSRKSRINRRIHVLENGVDARSIASDQRSIHFSQSDRCNASVASGSSMPSESPSRSRTRTFDLECCVPQLDAAAFETDQRRHRGQTCWHNIDDCVSMMQQR